ALVKARECADLLRGRHIQDFYGFICANRGQAPAVGVKCHPACPLSGQGMDSMAAERVPYVNGPICGTGSQATGIGGMERHADDGAPVTPESEELRAGLSPQGGCVPDVDGMISTG